MKLNELIKVTDAKLLNEIKSDFEIRISTDTRTIKKDDFYLPLKGANFDGEKFVKQAIDKGIKGTFVTEMPVNIDIENSDVVFLQVKDTLTSYLQLANYERKKKNYVVTAITGSSGKTTTKELIASVLSEKYKVFKTPLNHNNEIGFCQTIFETPKDTEILVLEMGMRGLGEIELLSKYSEPDITVISNVGTAHIGRLGSKENIAKAKCEIVKHQRGNVFIAHNDELIKNTVNFNGDKIFYSLNDVEILKKTSNVSVFKYQGNVYELNVGGNYNIENALAAINVATQLNMEYEEIANGLKNYQPIEKRWEKVNISGYSLINDSYNANPESMKVFVDTIFEHYKNYVLILGDMGELGADELYYHQELGRYINQHRLLDKNAIIMSVGKLSENITNSIANCHTCHFDNIGLCVDYIKKEIDKNSILFLKASRSMQFEKILTGLE